jgi:carboxyl-terminal processing protease
VRPSRRRARLPVALAALVLALLAFGIWVGGRHPGWLPGPVRAALVGDAQSAVVREAIDDVSRTYYRKIPKEQLADNAIEGVVRRLDDRFSNYFTAAEYKRFKASQNSEFSGIGLAVSEDRRGLRVEEVYDGSPADRAGIVAGDVVVKADGHDLMGRGSDESVSFIKGRPGTEVKVTWLHGDARRTKVITRNTVSVPVVASEVDRAGRCKIGVVRLAQFSSGAHAEVYAALRKARKAGATAFVLDLRGNGGGLVTEAQLVASAFLEDGVIVTTRGRSVPERTLRASGDAVVPKQPLVVLVDKNTASASEIVTGALQDRHRAKVVGARTFGKGVFQQVLELSNGGALDITAGQYFTPSGRNLGGKGVAPGSGISPDVEAMDDPKTKRDEAKARALSLLASSCRG